MRSQVLPRTLSHSSAGRIRRTGQDAVRCAPSGSQSGSVGCLSEPRFGCSGTDTRAVVCKAHPRRVAKVTKQIEREIGAMMLTDKVLMDVTQTRLSDGDKRGSLCSCSGVHVTNDLQVVKVYMSVLTQDAKARERILARLSGLSGYVRRRIGERVRLRLTPEVRFVHDEAVERGERVLSLLQQIGNGGDASTGSAGKPHQAVSHDTSEGFWDDQPAEQDTVGTTKPSNPFLEGVGEPAYDSDDDAEEPTFFSADMFPDANPLIEDISAQQKQAEWDQKQGKARYRVKSGKTVRM